MLSNNGAYNYPVLRNARGIEAQWASFRASTALTVGAAGIQRAAITLPPGVRLEVGQFPSYGINVYVALSNIGIVGYTTDGGVFAGFVEYEAHGHTYQLLSFAANGVASSNAAFSAGNDGYIVIDTPFTSDSPENLGYVVLDTTTYDITQESVVTVRLNVGLLYAGGSDGH